jgi:hypothetical protein
MIPHIAVAESAARIGSERVGTVYSSKRQYFDDHRIVR